MTCPHTSTLGVYLLGALEPEERSSFESHLYGCDLCRAELVRLAPLPGLLNQIAVADFEDPVEPVEPSGPTPEPAVEVDVVEPLELDPPDEPETPDEPAAARRGPRWLAAAAVPPKRRWQVAAAAAAVVVLTFAGFLGYQALQSAGGPQAHSVIWSAVDPDSGVRADVQLTERSWGTDIKVWMSNVPGSRECRLVVKAKSGYHGKQDLYVEVAGWWTSSHTADDDIPGSTSIDLASISKLEIMDGNRMLVGLQPTNS